VVRESIMIFMRIVYSHPVAGARDKFAPGTARGCSRLIETLPGLQHDSNWLEDVLKVDADEEGVGGDDAADALRYQVATKPRTLVVRRLTGW